jgi:hypothetical protein
MRNVFFHAKKKPRRSKEGKAYRTALLFSKRMNKSFQALDKKFASLA